MGVSGFDYSIVVTIHGPDISSDISDFPLLVHLSSSCGVYKQSMSHVFTELSSYSNRKKIAFTTGDGNTQCYAEIEYWNQSTPEAWIWVKVPTLYAKRDTILYLYYDSAAADNTTYIGDIGDTAGRAVWDSNFAAVWHMVDDASVTNRISDSTSNVRHATKNSTTQVSSLIGYGQQFSGTGYITVPGNILGGYITSAYTIEVIARNTGSARETFYFEGISTNQGSTINEILFWMESNYRLCSAVGGNASTYCQQTGTKFYSNTSAYYHHATRKWHPSGDELRITVEGYAADATTTSATLVSGMFDTGCIGRRYGYVNGSFCDDNYFVGIITEVRLHTIDRGTEWIAVSAASARDRLVSFGSTRCRSIVINSANVEYDGAFQVYIVIENNYNIGQYIQDKSKGCDIFFTDNNHNILPFDKINFSWTSSSVWKYEAFVRLTVSSTEDTDFYVCYGNPNYIDYSCPHGTFPKDDGFYAVYHTNLESYLGSNSCLDSGGTKYHGTPGGTIGSGDVVAGKIGKAIDFSSSSTDLISLPSTINSNLKNVSTLSVMCWVKPSTTAITAQNIVSFDISGNNAKLYLACSVGSAGNINIGGRTTTSESLQSKYSAAGQFTSGQWHHLVAEWDVPNDTVLCYKDASTVIMTGTIAWTNNYFSVDVGNGADIGNSYNNTGEFLGPINEVWIFKGLLSQARIQTFYNSQNSPSTFYTISPNDSYLNWEYAPDRKNFGINQKFDVKFRNQSRYSGYTTGWSMVQGAGNILQLSSTAAALGYGWVIKTFKKSDINGKWLYMSVNGVTSATGTIGYLMFYEGTMDETYNDYWPVGSDSTYTLISSRSMLVGTSSYTCVIPLDFDTSTGDYVTVAIMAADAWSSYTVAVNIRGFQILNPDSTIFAQACLDENMAINAALVWGKWGKNTGIPHQTYKVIFHDDFESGTFDNRWAISNSTYVKVISSDFSTLNYYKGRYYADLTSTQGYSATAYFPRTTRCMIVMDVCFASVGTGTSTSGYIIYGYNNLTNSGTYFLACNGGYYRYYDSAWKDFANVEATVANEWRRIVAVFEAPDVYSVWIDGKFLGSVNSIPFNYIDNIIFSTGVSSFYVGSVTVYDLNQPSNARLYDWATRIPFYVSKSDTAGTNCNIPLYLPVSTSSGKNNKDISDIIYAGSKKIAVTLGDGKTQCYVEEEDWGTTANLWFMGHTTDVCDTMYYVYYDLDQSDNTTFIGDTGSTAAQKVWDSDYLLVSHMKDSSGTVVDSTSNGGAFAKKGTGEPLQVSGYVGKAQDFDGTDDYISVAPSKILYSNDFSDSTVGSYPLHFLGTVSGVTTVLDGTNCAQLTNADTVRICDISGNSLYDIILTCKIKYVSGGYNRIGIFFESSINNWVFMATGDSSIDIWEMINATNYQRATTSFSYSGWHTVKIHIYYNIISVTIGSTTISYTGLTNYIFTSIGIRTWASCVGRFDDIVVTCPGLVGNLPYSTIEAIINPDNTADGYIYHEGDDTTSAVPEHSLSVTSGGLASIYHKSTASAYVKQTNNTDIRSSWNQLAMSRSSLYVPKLFRNGSEAVLYSNDFSDSKMGAHPSRFVETTNTTVYTVYDYIKNCKVAECNSNSSASNIYSGSMGSSIFASYDIRFISGTYNRFHMGVYDSSGNGVFIGCGAGNDQLNIYENISGTTYVRATVAFTYGTTWHTIRFYINGATAVAYIDGTSVSYSSLSTYSFINAFIRNWSSSINRFANIVIGTYSLSTYSGALVPTNFDIASIGRNKSYGLSGSGFINGTIDELRISRSNRSQGYLKTTYLSNSDQLLYILGIERTKPLSLTISGVVREEGTLVSRVVCLYRRINGALIAQTTSDPTTGSFSFTVNSTEEYYVVAFSDTIGPYNAIIFDHITGVA